jgi:hypothetical protein
MAALVSLPEDLKHLSKLYDAVDGDNPTKKDRQALKKALIDHPGLWRAVGDLARNAATNLADQASAPGSWKLSLIRGWDELQDELGAADASPVEKMIIQQVALSWMRLNHVEYIAVGLTTGDLTASSADYWEKRLNAAQRRFLRASETLARVRKINLQTIQINIANQQVNQING